MYKRQAADRAAKRGRWGLAALGLSGGFLDASGGGGWGPLTTSTLMSVGRREPRMVIGTVSASEFLVSLAASVGFIFGLGDELQHSWRPVVGLLIGGIIAAPIAAWAVTKVKPRVLGLFVGLLLIGLNTYRLIQFSLSQGTFLGGAAAPVKVIVILAAVAVLISLMFLFLQRKRNQMRGNTTAPGGGESVGSSGPAADLPSAERELSHSSR